MINANDLLKVIANSVPVTQAAQAAQAAPIQIIPNQNPPEDRNYGNHRPRGRGGFRGRVGGYRGGNGRGGRGFGGRGRGRGGFGGKGNENFSSQFP